MVATYLVALSGAFVVETNSGGGCTSWPLCGSGFSLPAGQAATINVAHRLVALVVVLLLGGLMAVIARRRRGDRAVRIGVMSVNLLLVLQVAAGARVVVLGLPAWVRGLHLALAAQLWGSVVLVAVVSPALPMNEPVTAAPAHRGRRAAAAGQGGAVVTVAVSLDALPRRRVADVARDYVALTKPRVILLLEVTAVAAMVIAAQGWPGWRLVLLTFAGGWLAASGANAINCWFDRDIDLTMGRTRARPLPSGRLEPRQALTFGVVLGAASFALLATTVNVLAASLALLALLFYVFVYTMWLKRSSMQNIVIGGAAGAIPPLVGWAAVTGSLDLTAVFLFAVVFYWTPPHFWALSLLLKGDYSRAGVPMLPVVQGDRQTRYQIVLYTIVLCLVTVLPLLTRSFGAVYLGGAAMLDAVLLTDAVVSAQRPTARSARRLFYHSMIYLALLFAVMAIDRVTGL